MEDAAGRVLSRDVRARISSPVVRASALDGLAVQASRLAGIVPSNSVPVDLPWRVDEDYAWADTGEDFDDTFDAVIPVEYVSFPADGVLRLAPGVAVQRGMNIRLIGSRVLTGDLLLRRHTRLGPRDLALLLGSGIRRLMVLKKPRVAIVPTGNELVSGGATPLRGNYIESSSLFLRESLKPLGAAPFCLPIVKDVGELLEEALQSAAQSADIVLITGGTSKGRRDVTNKILDSYRGALYDDLPPGHGMRMRLAMIGNVPVINLPGPPESVYRLEWYVHAVVAHALRQPYSVPRFREGAPIFDASQKAGKK